MSLKGIDNLKKRKEIFARSHLGVIISRTFGELNELIKDKDELNSLIDKFNKLEDWRHAADRFRDWNRGDLSNEKFWKYLYWLSSAIIDNKIKNERFMILMMRYTQLTMFFDAKRQDFGFWFELETYQMSLGTKVIEMEVDNYIFNDGKGAQRMMIVPSKTLNLMRAFMEYNDSDNNNIQIYGVDLDNITLEV